MSPVRILHIFGRMQRSGAELRTLEVMRRVDRTRFALDYCVLSGREGELDSEIAALGGRVHRCKLDSLFPVRFLRLLASQRYDVVHSHVHYFSGVTLAMAEASGVPVRIAHFRSTSDGRKGLYHRGKASLMRKLIGFHATAILGVCEGALAATWSSEWMSDARCRVIYNGIDPKRFAVVASRTEARSALGLPEAAWPVVVHIGRFDPAKNHRRAIQIAAATLRAAPSAMFLFAGRTSAAEEHLLRSWIASAGLSGKVILLGERDDIPAVLRACDVLLFPSLWEGLPGAVLEARAAGVPVVASNLPGVREIADRIGGVRMASLTKSDERWADEIYSAALRPDQQDERVRALRTIEDSVFDIGRATSALVREWSR